MSALAGYYSAAFQGFSVLDLPVASSYALELTGETASSFGQFNCVDSVELWQYVGSVPQRTSLIQNPSFEADPISDWAFQPPSTTWQYLSTAGTQRNGSGIGARDTYDGSQTGLIYCDGGAMGILRQVVALQRGVVYFLRYGIIARDPSGNAYPIDFRPVARLNGTEILRQDLPYAPIYQPYPQVQSAPFRIY